MHPWVLFVLYNIKCCISRTLRAPKWKNANLKFRCVLESPRGPLRFDLIVNFHDGMRRPIDLMKLKTLEISSSSRPSLVLTWSSSTSVFQVQDLKYRQAKKVESILANVEKVVLKQSGLKSTRVSWVDEDCPVEESVTCLMDPAASVDKTDLNSQNHQTLFGSNKLSSTESFSVRSCQRRKTLKCLAEIEKSTANLVPSQNEETSTDMEDSLHCGPFDKVFLNGVLSDDGLVTIDTSRRKKRLAHLTDAEDINISKISSKDCALPKLVILPSWASNTSGVSVSGATSSSLNLKLVRPPCSPVKVDCMLSSRSRAKSILKQNESPPLGLIPMLQDLEKSSLLESADITKEETHAPAFEHNGLANSSILTVIVEHDVSDCQ